MLKLDGVHKKFKSALVAEKISVDLGPCTYGLLGRNGSGKTTLLRCITRVEKVNGGRIVYTDGDGREVKDYLDHIGYLPQNFDVFPELTAYEVLQFFANLKGYKITEAEIDHLLEILNLSPQRDMTVKTPVRRHEAAAGHCPGADRRPGCAAAGRTYGGTGPGGTAEL